MDSSSRWDVDEERVMRAIGYARVSTDDQHLGVDAQRAAMETWCRQRKLDLVAVHVDHGVSGGAPVDERPGLMAALADLQRGDVLLVARRDRLARDVVQAALTERLAERVGAKVCSCAGEGEGDTPTDQLLRRIVDCFAEYERAMIRARTRAAMGVKRARGEYTGGRAPYGWRRGPGGRLVEDVREQEAQGFAFGCKRQGNSLRMIARRLDEEGYPTRGGTPWGASQVAALLRQGVIDGDLPAMGR